MFTQHSGKISFQGLFVSPDKTLIKKILKLSIPTDIKKGSYGGFVDFYRSYIPHCTGLSEPFAKPCKENVDFVWIGELQKSLD